MERVNSSSKHIRLNYFEQQENTDGGKLGNGSQIRILGPGLPVNVDEWPKKASRQQKVESLAIEFEGETGMYLYSCIQIFQSLVDKELILFI